MKTNIILLASALMVFSTNSFSQGATANTTATATIITPISITNDVPLNFGDLAVDGSSTGTLTIATDGTRTASGSVTIINAAPGSPTVASFTVGGTGAYTYAITLTGSPVTLTGPSGTITAGTFVTDPSGTGALTAGAGTILLGATLNVAASQAAGLYVSGATGIGVTVNYN